MNLTKHIQSVFTAVLLSLSLVSFSQVYYVGAGEYFVDTDPGVGLATPLSATDGSFNDVWEKVQATVASQPAGLHTIGIRLQDGNGNWGNTFTRAISVENLLTARDVKITAGEFFIDTDPGEGSGTPLLAFDGNFNDAFETALLNTIAVSVGLHTLNVRVVGLDGAWSNVFSRTISVENILTARDIKITEAEFFIDTDPGEGNATAMLAFDGNFNDAFEVVAQSGVAVSVGLHTLNIRVLGFDGAWSNVFTRVITVENLLTARDVKITGAEYFWDTDPGQGSGIAMIAFDGNFNNAFEQASTNAIATPSVGNHTLGIRTIGLDGTWSNVFTTIVAVENLLTVRNVKITGAEYFWDTDPGQGSGIAMIAFDGNYNNAFEQAIVNAIATPSVGNHTIGIRTIGLDGTWSNVFTTIVAVENLLTARDVKITQGEFFWDTDPGQGGGIVMIAFDGNFNNAFEQVVSNSVSSPGNGTHKLFVRTRGLDGTWSNTFSTIVVIENPLTVRDVRITQAEFFFDTDPGEGSGNPLLAFDGNFNNAFEKVSANTNSALVDVGAHVLNVRHLGLDGDWSNTMQSVIYIDPCLTSPVVTTTPNGTISICPEDSLLLTATAGLVSYQWFSGLNQVGSAQTLYVDDAAFYRVIGFDNDGCPGTSPNVQILEYAVPNNTISVAGSLSFCTGGSVSLTASGGFANYLWSNGATTQGIVVTTAGSYSCVATTGGGCQRTSNTVVVTVYSAPPAPVITPSSAVICIGGDVTLTSNYATNILWNTGATTQSILVTNGNYSVTYTDGSGCSSIGYATVALSDAIASIQASAIEVWMPSSNINFTSNTVGTITSYLWDFDDGNTSTSNDPSHTYTVSGNYTVTLSVDDSNGCTTFETYPFTVTVWEVFPTDDVSLPTNSYIFGATWLSPLIGYVTLPNGQLCYTTDGGLTWVPVVGCGGDDIQGITYVGDANNYCLYTFGNNGSVYESCNGGAFLPISPGGLPGGTNFYGGFWSGGYGYFFGSNNTICYYYNGTWYSINPSGAPGGTTWYGGWSWGGYLFAYGSGGIICYYYNGSWYPAGGAGGGGGWNFYGGYYSGASNCAFAVGSGGVVCVSYDGGLTWSPVNTGFPYTWYDCFISGSTVILVGEDGAICISTDGGLTWTLYSIGSNHTCTGISVNGCLAYITTDDGGVYQFPLDITIEAPVIESDATEVCPGSPVLLKIQNPRFGSEFIWSNGATGASTLINASGIYYVTEYQQCDTMNSNSIGITAVTGDTYYRDFDNDDYGDANVTQISCSGTPLGYVTNDDDCDDSNNEVFPGASGTGDGVDNNCNGAVQGDEIYCPYDLNNDNIVNTSDLLLLMGYFGVTCQPGCPGDFTNDGGINVSDLLVFMGAFGTTCN